MGLLGLWVLAWSALTSVVYAQHEKCQSCPDLVRIAHEGRVASSGPGREWGLNGILETPTRAGFSDDNPNPQMACARRYETSSEPLDIRIRKPRTRTSHIGSIMALLSTFHEAQALPPEHDPRANQLIHGLIQLQSVVLKSQAPAVRDFLKHALGVETKKDFETIQANLFESGLTMQVLESLIDHAESNPPWANKELRKELLSYNVQLADWKLIHATLVEARKRLALTGQTLKQVYAQQRRAMSGAVP